MKGMSEVPAKRKKTHLPRGVVPSHLWPLSEKPTYQDLTEKGGAAHLINTTALQRVYIGVWPFSAKVTSQAETRPPLLSP